MRPGIMLMLEHPREREADRRALPRWRDDVHHDMIHREVPSKGRCCIGRNPDAWRNTLFASGYAA